MIREKTCPVCQRSFAVRSNSAKYCPDCAKYVAWLRKHQWRERYKEDTRIMCEAFDCAGPQCHGRSGSMLNEDPGYMPYIANPTVIWRR